MAQHNRLLSFLPAITQSGCKESKKNPLKQERYPKFPNN